MGLPLVKQQLSQKEARDDNLADITGKEVVPILRLIRSRWNEFAGFFAGPIDVSTGGAMQYVDTYATLRGITSSTPNAHVGVISREVLGDFGGGIFYWEADSVEPDNDGTTLAPSDGSVGRWRRIFDGTNVSAAWFGVRSATTFATTELADAYGSTNRLGIQTAIDFVQNLGGGVVFLPGGGDIFINDTILIGAGYTGVTLQGQGQGYADSPRAGYGSTLRCSNDFPYGERMLVLKSARRCKVDNLGFDGTSPRTFTANASILTSAAHGLVDGQIVFVNSTVALPAPLFIENTYVVTAATTDTFQLRYRLTGEVITLTSAGTGIHTVNGCRAGVALDDTSTVATGLNIACKFDRMTFRGITEKSWTFTVDASTDTVTAVGNRLPNGAQVYFSSTGTLPAGTSAGTYLTGTRYYISTKVGDTFKLYNAAGTLINITGAGTGVHTLTSMGIACHVGGYLSGIQVSNSVFDTGNVTDCDFGIYIDGSSGTTDIKFENWEINNRVAGVICDTGEATFEHVNVNGVGAGPDLLVRPTFGDFIFRDARLESFGEICLSMPAGVGGRAAYTTVIDGCRWQFANSNVVTADPTSDAISLFLHYYAIDDRVDFVNIGGALPTGLVAGTRYYVIADGLTANTFKVSLASGGAAVDITDAGTGFQFVRGNEKIVDYNQGGPLTFIGTKIYRNDATADSGYCDIPGDTVLGGAVDRIATRLYNQADFRNRGGNVTMLCAGSGSPGVAGPTNFAPILGLDGMGLYISAVSFELHDATTLQPDGWGLYNNSINALKLVDATATHPTVCFWENGGNMDLLNQYRLAGQEIAKVTGGIVHLSAPTAGAYITIGNTPGTTGQLRLGRAAIEGLLSITQRNNADDDDLRICTIDTGDGVIYGWDNCPTTNLYALNTVNFATDVGSTVKAYVGTNGLRNKTTSMGFDTGVTNPELMIDDVATNSATGKALIVRGQKATGTTSVGGGVSVRGSTGTSTNGAVTIETAAGTAKIKVDDTGVGFFGGGTVAQQTVTGAKIDLTATGALQSLLTALANLGLIIDSST